VKVTISVPGKFQPAYLWARYLDEHGELERIVTSIPYGRLAVFKVRRAKTVRLTPFAYWYHAFERYGPPRSRSLNQLIYSVAFDHAASALIGDADVFNGWSNIALTSMRKARERGMTTILQTGSTHIEWQTEVLRAESERWKVGIPITHPKLVARSVAEYENADAIVVPSKFARETFLARGIPASSVHVVPWAVRPVTEAPFARRRTGIPRILFVGTCKLGKGVPYLFDAFRQLRSTASLRMVGPPMPHVFAAAGGIPDGVEIVGRRRGNLLAAEYREADIFVLPSVDDGSATVVGEALAAGLPVVVSDRAGADSLVNGVNGFVVGAANSTELAARLEELIGDPELRAVMGREAAATARRRSWRDYGTDLRQLFEEIHGSTP
jgi:starch synthase